MKTLPTTSFTLQWFKRNNTVQKNTYENNTHTIYMQCSALLAQKKKYKNVIISVRRRNPLVFMRA